MCRYDGIRRGRAKSTRYRRPHTRQGFTPTVIFGVQPNGSWPRLHPTPAPTVLYTLGSFCQPPRMGPKVPLFSQPRAEPVFCALLYRGASTSKRSGAPEWAGWGNYLGRGAGLTEKGNGLEHTLAEPPCFADDHKPRTRIPPGYGAFRGGNTTPSRSMMSLAAVMAVVWAQS